jgi:hypothetical protein
MEDRLPIILLHAPRASLAGPQRQLKIGSRDLNGVRRKAHAFRYVGAIPGEVTGHAGC